MVLLLLSVAFGGDVVLRNDTSDTYDGDDQLAWLAFPECAISVLEAESGDLPLQISYVQVLLASNTGNDDGESTLAEVGVQVLADGEDPNPTHFEWGPETFTVTVSSTAINELSLVDEASGWYPMDYTAGRIAVWVCPPDPETGESWPRVNDRDQSGVVIDTSAPSAGTWLSTGSAVVTLQSLGAKGSWVIHAGAGEGGGTDTGGTDTGSDDTGGTDTGDDTGGTDTGGSDADLTVTSITPTGTTVGETVELAVLGGGFVDGAQVYVGGLAASGVTLSGAGALTATTPSALPVGVHDVLVTLPGGDSATLPSAFTVAEAGCGCSAGTGAAWAWGLAAAASLARRRG